MFTDWVTISGFGTRQYDAASAIWRRIEALKTAYPHVYTRRTFGSLSVCLPGQHWQSIEEQDGFTLVDDVMHFCSGAHVTRFDLAHDWSLDTVDAGKIWHAVAECGADIDRLIGHRGTTWYIGSRESDFFARLYDKTAEIRARTGVDIKFPVLRFEAEMKGQAASEFFFHWRRAPEAVQNTVAQRYNLAEFLIGSSSEVIRVMGLPPADPFAFVRKFARCITYARTLDPAKFDEIIPKMHSVTALPPDTA